jgi:hypothetical protein
MNWATERKENSSGKVLPFYAVQLRHLVVPKARLTASCGACTREGDLDPVELGWRFGPMFSIRDLHKRLKCRHCGMKGWCDISLTWLDPG